MTISTQYSHAAPYIREAALNAADLKLGARTQRDAKGYTGQMQGLIHALEVLLHSPEGVDSPTGYPDFHGSPRAIPELERYVGGPDRFRELGFTGE